MGISRVTTANMVATAVMVFVRKARRDGCSNLITDDAIQSAAEGLKVRGADYSMGTVRSIITRECRANGESALIAPGWGK